MARITIVFGALLAMIGVAWFIATGSSHPTALIPAWFGMVLAVCGLLARTEDPRKRMLWMHIAVTVGLLGFIFPAVRSAMAFVKAHGSPLPHAAAVVEEVVMAAVCLVFVVLCIRSFIAARRARIS